ncbi:MAG TPA: ABC transporter ATP-binding protein [Burkholderiales bacterium]|nr:ABC transporter ATP-binding protein [Burkholderiales bacterium]
MQLACKNLTVSYHHHPAIHHLTCDFKIGTTTAIVGSNGAGKSTLLKAILGELKPDTGEIIIQGINKKDIAYLPQSIELDNLLPLSVSDVILLGSWHTIGLFDKVNYDSQLLVNDCLEQVGLSGFNKRFIHELSKGQLQRVYFARIIMQQASIIILDEPFNAIDSKTITDIQQIIKKWHQQGKTVIAVLHDLQQVVASFEYTLLLAKELISYDKTALVLNKENLSKAYSNNFLWLDNNFCRFEENPNTSSSF